MPFKIRKFVFANVLSSIIFSLFKLKLLTSNITKLIQSLKVDFIEVNLVVSYEDKFNPVNSLQFSKVLSIFSTFFELKFVNFISSKLTQFKKAELILVISSDSNLDKSTFVKCSQSWNISDIVVNVLLKVIFIWTIPSSFAL